MYHSWNFVASNILIPKTRFPTHYCSGSVQQPRKNKQEEEREINKERRKNKEKREEKQGGEGERSGRRKGRKGKEKEISPVALTPYLTQISGSMK